jgi:hypothetical protein
MKVRTMKKIENKTFSEERALYNSIDTEINNCNFAGPLDGESVLKECRNIIVNNSMFSLRYPVWHAHKFIISNCVFDEKTRAPFWYDFDGTIQNSTIKGTKFLREAHNVVINDSNIESAEVGWMSEGITLLNDKVVSEYLFLKSKDIKINKLNFTGKYSFQYVENMLIENSVLDTKDAFWHSKNVTVKNSTIKGEYLAWFSDSLTLINCKIISHQPLCYCKNLKLIDCVMLDCDLAFEYSDVEATIIGKVDSVKNPKSGKIICDEVGKVINEKPIYNCDGKVELRNN